MGNTPFTEKDSAGEAIPQPYSPIFGAGNSCTIGSEFAPSLISIYLRYFGLPYQLTLCQKFLFNINMKIMILKCPPFIKMVDTNKHITYNV